MSPFIGQLPQVVINATGVSPFCGQLSTKLSSTRLVCRHPVDNCQPSCHQRDWCVAIQRTTVNQVVTTAAVVQSASRGQLSTKLSPQRQLCSQHLEDNCQPSCHHSGSCAVSIQRTIVIQVVICAAVVQSVSRGQLSSELLSA